MKILAFSTIDSAISIALLNDKKIIAKSSVKESGKQAELLIPEIEKILQENNLNYSDLDLITTINGPGSFTSIRIGLTAAKIFKLASKLPLITLNSCEVIAYKYRHFSGKIITLIDAKMDEFFYGEFLSQNQQIKQVSELQLVKLEELSQVFPQENFLLCGSGKNIAAKILEKDQKIFEMTEEEDLIEADVIGLMAYEKFLSNQNNGKENPIYIRQPKIGKRKK